MSNGTENPNGYLIAGCNPVRVSFGPALLTVAVLKSDRRVARRLGQIIGLAALAVLAVAGCERQPPVGTSGSERNLEKVALSEDASRYETTGEVLEQEHDFGVLRPGKTVEHRFPIRNDSSGKWTVRKIVNTCSCTATDLSAPLISPGETEYVTVSYKPGHTSHDDRRKIAVVFEEADAPVVFLVVSAMVREAMTAVPSELAFRQLGKGQSRQGNFEIRNFSDRNWQSISLEPSKGWLTASHSRVQTAVGEDSPRQVWRVTVRADATGVPSGRHEAQLVVRADGADDITQVIPVHASVTSPVSVIPGQLFFGSVPAGTSVTRTVTLRFSPDAVPENAESVVLDHNLGDQLQTTWSRRGGESWELTATLTPDGRGGVSGENLRIVFSKPTMPQLELPIYAFVEER